MRPNVLSLDRARIPVERVRAKRPNAEVSFTVPAPPNVIEVPSDEGRMRWSEDFFSWRKAAGLEARRQGARSFGGAVSVEVLVPRDKARPVEGYLKVTLELLRNLGVVQGDGQVDDLRARRAERADVLIVVRGVG